ncbi:MAG TPA: multicopper oxidase family protein [Chitinophagales bacterium]|nr:multicopper oxidase family protein [Chitinophagales bacterium]HMU68727.1 multicopper oxidase family protein [Chitinophagales bacterium]HMX04265.1 multicopper oxidase family protein [Chitinophagales bacterium]HMZ87982.1 multicopper oxidase family protein [Chitinophagales bacterium]HNA56664.1 multicopper oxidase family protein [Chitinophagales bacterium]
MNRRSFLRNTLAGTTAIAVTPAAFLASCSDGNQDILDDVLFGTVGGTTVPTPPFVSPFNTLDTQVANGSTITANRNFYTFAGISGTFCYGYSESVWGPTLTANTGDNISLTLESNLSSFGTNLHFHGLTLDASQEDGVENGVASGASKSYSFTVNNRAGMYWYHAQYQKLGGDQLGLGLGGLFIVSDSEEDALNLPNGNLRSTTISLQDKRFNEDNQMLYGPNKAEYLTGYFGGTILVNGRIGVFKNVSSRFHRLRIINGSTARIYNLSISTTDGTELDFNIIGNDGGLLKSLGGGIKQVLLAPGERLDSIIDFSTLSVGTEVLLSSNQFNAAGDYQGVTGFDIMKFVIDTADDETWSLPDDLSDITTLTEGDVTGETRNFDIANANISKDEATNNTDNMHTINGDAYDAGTVNFTVNAGTTEKWVLDNTGGSEPRVMHIYGVQFQVLDRTGGRGSVKQWEKGWKDTILLLPDEVVTLLVPFTTAPGVYYLASTNQEHADTGLINRFEIV